MQAPPCRWTRAYHILIHTLRLLNLHRFSAKCLWAGRESRLADDQAAPALPIREKERVRL